MPSRRTAKSEASGSAGAGKTVQNARLNAVLNITFNRKPRNKRARETGVSGGVDTNINQNLRRSARKRQVAADDGIADGATIMKRVRIVGPSAGMSEPVAQGKRRRVNPSAESVGAGHLERGSARNTKPTSATSKVIVLRSSTKNTATTKPPQNATAVKLQAKGAQTRSQS
eukprot:5821304-Pyramimonas_sp.AAC.1